MAVGAVGAVEVEADVELMTTVAAVVVMVAIVAMVMAVEKAMWEAAHRQLQ
jgi:hypothetical protein